MHQLEIDPNWFNLKNGKTGTYMFQLYWICLPSHPSLPLVCMFVFVVSFWHLKSCRWPKLPRDPACYQSCGHGEHYGSVLWRDVSRNGIFWCPFLVLGIGYWVLDIGVYTYIYICIIYWILGIGVYTCDITWSVIMKQHRAQTNAQYQYACLSLEVCFDVMVYGRSSWNNIWPVPRPNTNMRDWVWMMEVCFDLMVHGQSSWKNTWPKPRPNTNMRDWVWMMEVGFETILHS